MHATRRKGSSSVVPIAVNWVASCRDFGRNSTHLQVIAKLLRLLGMDSGSDARLHRPSVPAGSLEPAVFGR